MTKPRTFINIKMAPNLERDVKGRWKKASADFNRRNWILMGQYAKKAASYTQADAPEGKTGKFKKSIRARRYRRAKTIVGFTMSMAQPLGTFITKGTKRHIIRARSANALAFFWGKIGMRVVVPKRGGFKTHVRNDVLWVGKGHVNHPGTKANPFHVRAKRRWWPQMAKEIKRISRNYSADLVDV